MIKKTGAPPKKYATSKQAQTMGVSTAGSPSLQNFNVRDRHLPKIFTGLADFWNF